VPRAPTALKSILHLSLLLSGSDNNALKSQHIFLQHEARCCTVARRARWSLYVITYAQFCMKRLNLPVSWLYY